MPSLAMANNSFERCLGAAYPRIEFYSSLGKLEYDFTKNNKELEQIAGEKVSGLAHRKLGQYVTIETDGVRYGKGYCVTPTMISVYIGVGRPTIYVSSDLEKDTCLYNFVLRHEEAHMQTTIRMLDHFVKSAPTIFKLSAKKIRPVYVNSPSEANNAAQILADEYNKIAEELRNKLHEETEKEQNKIDDPKLNRLAFEVCKNFMER